MSIVHLKPWFDLINMISLSTEGGLIVKHINYLDKEVSNEFRKNRGLGFCWSRKKIR